MIFCKHNAAQINLINTQQVCLAARGCKGPLLVCRICQITTKLAERQITIYREWLTITLSVWPTAGQIASPSPMQAIGIKQTLQWTCTAQWWLAMAARDEGHGICMHMGIDRWVFEVVKSPWGLTCIFAISVTPWKNTTQSRQNRMPLHLNAKSPKQNPGMSDIWCAKMSCQLVMSWYAKSVLPGPHYHH